MKRDAPSDLLPAWQRTPGAAFARKYLRADVRAGDRFVFIPSPGARLTTPEEFLWGGLGSRIFLVTWHLLTLIVCAAITVFFLLLFVSLWRSDGAGPYLALLPLPLSTLWGVISSQAIVRWMLRNIRQPQRSRPAV